MKSILYFLIFISVCTVFGKEDPRENELPPPPVWNPESWVEGRAVGAAAQPGKFYLKAKKYSKEKKKEDFLLMTKDADPVIRALGLVCLARNKIELPDMTGDKGQITVFPYGCGGDDITIEEFSKSLFSDKYFRYGFLDEKWTNKNSNKASEGISRSSASRNPSS